MNVIVLKDVLRKRTLKKAATVICASILVLLVVSFLSSCGKDEENHRAAPTQEVDKTALEKRILALEGTLDTLVSSDFKTCANTGETADLVIRNICKIAQAANAETRAELSNIVGQVRKDLQRKIEATEIDVVGALSSIDTLNTQLASLTALVSAGVFSVEIGTELVSAGPIREVVLMKQDRTRLNAYIDAVSANISLANNPVTTSNGSTSLVIAKPTSTITVTIATPGVVTYTAHGLNSGDPVMFTTTGALPTGLVASTVYYVRNKTVNTFEVSATQTGASINTSGSQSGTHTGSLGISAGDLISLSGLAAGRGQTGGSMTGEFRATAATISSVTISSSLASSSSGSTGSTLGTISRVVGRGMSTKWVLADGSDVAVRTTSTSSRPYNFIIKVISSLGCVCYDTTNASAVFGTIDAASSCPGVTANITCK